MKLIQILALATAMATMATAQNAGTNNQKKGGATPTPSPTPTPAGAAKSGSKPPAGTKTPVSTGQPSATKKGIQPSGVKPADVKSGATKTGTTGPATAKAANSQKPASKTATAGSSSTAIPLRKPTVKSGNLPVKAKTGQAKTGQSKIKAAPGVTPPVQTKAAAKTTEKSTAKTKAAVPTVKSKALAKGPKQAVTKTGTSAATKNTPPKVKEMGRPATAEKPKPVAGRALGARGRRDPFVSPIRNLSNVAPTPTCTSGKRCLSIPELVLQGTVKDLTGKMMAVVANSSHHTYFLRENDQVFNGSVEKITSDSIIFREFVKDALGRETAREVVKKLGPTT